MKWLESRILWGGLLVLGGVLYLLQNLGIVSLGNLYWSLLLAMAGVFFFSLFLQNRENWWALIPGFTFFAIALSLLLRWLAPGFTDTWGASIILGGIGVGFLAIFLVERQLWWTLVPAGVFATLAVVAGLSHFMPSLPTSGVFFLGMGLTFGLVGLTSQADLQMNWAWIPAGSLLVLGFLFLFATQELVQFLWPVVLILAGGILIFRTVRSNG